MRSHALSGFLLASLLAVPAYAEKRSIDPEGSTLTIHVDKSGVLSAFGDRHTIRAPISSGAVEVLPEKSVEITVEAGTLKVLDPDLSEKKRLEVQQRTLGPDVLDVDRYQKIHFRSTKVSELGGGRWRVEGVLDLHGKSGPISFEVTEESGRVRGSATLSQRAFGIEPVAVAGGTVKVKNEVRIELDVRISGSGGSPGR